RVAHRDRQTLTDDRVVVAGRVANQHDAVGVRRTRPGVVAGIRRARTGRRGGHDLLAPRVALDVAAREEGFGSAATGEAMWPGRAEAQIDARAAAALMEHEEVQVAFTRDDVVIVGYAVEPIDEQPRDVVDGLLAFDRDAGLLPNSGGAPVGTN